MTLDEMLHILKGVYESEMPFNRHLGIQIVSITPGDISVQIDMQDCLIGNYVRGILHGGVISSVLDLTGGLIASVELLKNLKDYEPSAIKQRMTRIGTIDLRIDFLRAGKGDNFTASGSILRKGNKVAVTRTELVNNHNSLIAAGTGTYLIG